MRIRWMLAAAVAALIIAGPAAAAKKNIVIVITDDQSPTAGCYGDPVIKTPNLDRIAADGVLFNYAFATTASCSASRSVVLTGLHNHANGHYGHQHSYHKFSSYDWVKTLPVILAQMGYRTARIGKHHNAPEEVYFFEDKLPGNGRSPVDMAENCREFINRDANQPFFLYYATSDPHRGGGEAEELPYAPNRFGNPKPGDSYPGVTEVTYKPEDVTVPPFLPDTPTCRAELAQYYQSISRVDQGLGVLVQIIKDAGQWDDTLILYTSDHGMAFPGGKTTTYEGGLRVPFVVRNPYEKNRGVTTDAMVSLVDVTPTLIDFAGGLDHSNNAVKAGILEPVEDPTRRARRVRGQQRPYVFHGRSFLPILANPDKIDGWDKVYASHTFHEITMYYPMRVVRERQYKLIWNIAHPLPYPFASDLWAAPTWQAQWKQGMDAKYGQRTVGEYIHRPEFELFDLLSDPNESRNLADDPSHAPVLARLKDEIKKFQKEANDPWILKWDYE